MKKFIKKINILGVDYKIYKSDKIPTNYIAICDKTEKIILCDVTLKGEELHATLIHEIFHAICHESGIDQVLTEGTEQILCESFSKAISRIYNKPKWVK